MSDMTEQQLEQMPAEPPKPEQLPGRRLREAREAAGLSRGEIALQMHISESKVADLEADNYAALPSAIYVSGYLRSYARLLGLPEESFVFTQKEVTAAESLVTNVGKQNQPSSLDLPVRMVTWLIVGIAIISIVTWLVAQRKPEVAYAPAVAESPAEPAQAAAQTAVAEESVSLPDTALSPVSGEDGMMLSVDGDTGEQEASASSSMEAEAVTASVTAEPVMNDAQADFAAETQTVAPTEGAMMPALDEPLPPPLTDDVPQSRLMLEYQADCWTEVDDSAGRHLVYGLMRSGQHLELKGEAPFKVFLGYAPGATVHYNGGLFDHSSYQRGDIARFRVGRAEQNQPVSR